MNTFTPIIHLYNALRISHVATNGQKLYRKIQINLTLANFVHTYNNFFHGWEQPAMTAKHNMMVMLAILCPGFMRIDQLL